MTQTAAARRVRAFGYFIIAGIYFFFAQTVASHAARGLSSGEWSEVVARLIFLFLLLLGYAAMARAFEAQRQPLRSMGLVFRPDWKREFGLGAALGWGMMVASILPMVLAGGLIVTIFASAHQFVLLGIDVVALAVASLAEEVAFRGYPFQRLIEAIGPFLATLVMSALFGLAHMLNPAANRGSVIVTMFAGWLLSAAYLRTRALWFSWGWHFAWNASMGLIFGLPISGITRFSPVVQSNTIGGPWITGGDYGPEASLVTAIVMLIGLVLAFRITRSYAYKYAQPVIVTGGMPVDLDAMNRVVAPHHSAAAAPAGEKLVQISSAPGSAADPSVAPRPAQRPAPASREQEAEAWLSGESPVPRSSPDPLDPLDPRDAEN